MGYFNDRANHDNVPVRARVGQLGNKVEINAFVYHAIITQSGKADRRLIIWVLRGRTCGFEVPDINAGRKTMHRMMTAALRFVQAFATGKH